jgi:peroxiredoxin Q/BCP
MNAPHFSLKDQNGQTHTLEKYRGNWVLVYFYPKDNTPGCTKQACGIRDGMNDFKQRGIMVLGISKDSVASHQKFATKHNLSFPLLSDPTSETIKAFGAWGSKKFMGREFEGILRNSYLIDTHGTIVKTYEKVNPHTHSSQILKDFDLRINQQSNHD